VLKWIGQAGAKIFTDIRLAGLSFATDNRY